MAHVWRSEVTRIRFERFQELRRQGNSIARCARLIGINRDSAVRYDKISKSITLEDLGTKYDLVKTLWGLLGSEEVKPQYKSSVAGLIANLNGWLVRPTTKPAEPEDTRRADLDGLVKAWRGESPRAASHRGGERASDGDGADSGASATEPPGSPQASESGNVLPSSPSATNSEKSGDS